MLVRISLAVATILNENLNGTPGTIRTEGPNRQLELFSMEQRRLKWYTRHDSHRRSESPARIVFNGTTKIKVVHPARFERVTFSSGN